jgi:hypothetical protein
LCIQIVENTIIKLSSTNLFKELYAFEMYIIVIGYKIHFIYIYHFITINFDGFFLILYGQLCIIVNESSRYADY